MMHTKPTSALLVLLSALLFATIACAAQNSPVVPVAEEAPPVVTVSHPPTVGDGTAFACTFTGKADDLDSVTVTFLNRAITVSNDGSGTVTLLLPVPLDQPSGPADIAWTARFLPVPRPDGKAPAGAPTLQGTSSVRIEARAYPVQKLTVAPKYVTPDPDLKERIDRERKLMGAALTTQSATRHWALPMARPVPGKITSLYGLRRVLNGQPRAPHKGLDFRAAEGTPIAAIADGTVVLAGDFYYAGKFVVVDHGIGVVSIAMHMSETIAEHGQRVTAGDVIGLVGSTGRSTGPHLHLGVSVLGQSIDALTLIALTEEDKALYHAAIKNVSAAPAANPAPKSTGGQKKKSGAPSKKKTAGPAKTGGNAAKTGTKTQ